MKNKRSFKKAVRKKSGRFAVSDTIETLFTSSNYLFSTRAKNRKETLYFEDRATKQTGRLRQQHRSGPLAKIDEKAKTHRFLSKKRFKFLKKWHKQNKDCLPKFYVYEKRLKSGRHHIEFAYDGKEVSGWHPSAGTVEMSKRRLEHRISSALKEILGVRNK